MMSEQAIDLLARSFAGAKEKQHQRCAHDLKQNELLDEGFKRLRADVDSQLAELIDKLNSRPEIGNILSVAIHDSETVLHRSDLGSNVTIKYDSHRHTARLIAETPVKLDYIVGVKADGIKWFYRGGTKFEDAANSSETANKVVHALLGV